jgi:hypothetical protein
LEDESHTRKIRSQIMELEWGWLHGCRGTGHEVLHGGGSVRLHELHGMENLAEVQIYRCRIAKALSEKPDLKKDP